MPCKGCGKSKVGKVLRGAIGLTKAAVGADYAPRDVIVKRRTACRTCDQRTGAGPIQWLHRCRLCDCFILPKTTQMGEVCGLAKW